MPPSYRLQVAQRLSSRKNDHAPVTVPMVRRIRKESVLATTSHANFKATAHDVKSRGNWRYKNGVIERAPSVTINGKRYTDPKSPGEARRKQESNFFLTINTNKYVGGGNAGLLTVGQKALKKTLEVLGKEEVICSYLKYGPKDPVYSDDRHADVIRNIDWKAAVEVGPNLDRLHAHAWITIQHYSQIQLNPHTIAFLTIREFNAALGNDSNHPLYLDSLPYVHIKLLPQSDFTDIMRQYLHKGMMGVGSAS